MFFEFVTVQIQQNMNVALEELNAFVLQYIPLKNMNYVFYICSYVTVINSYQGTCVTAAGLRASNSRNTSVWPELIRLGTRRVVTATRSVTVMEYYFYLRAGTRTSHTERWRALSSRYSLLLGCWPFGFPIMLTLKNRCAAPESLLLGYGYPGKIRRRKKQSSLFSENR